MRLRKDSFGRYLLGDPLQAGRGYSATGGTLASAPRLFEQVVPVITSNITQGSFLIGNSDPAAAEIRDRQELTVEISTSHEDYFARNMVAIRAERREALVVKRPDSFLYGTLTSSPA